MVRFTTGLVGTPEQISTPMRAFEAVGIETFLLQFHPVVEELERFGDKIIPLLRRIYRLVCTRTHADS